MDNTMPATETTTIARIATLCACCGRALTDAVSMNRGVGPECSGKYYSAPPTDNVDFATLARGLEGIAGFGEWAKACAVAGDALLEGDRARANELAGRFNSRALANALTIEIALEQKGPRVEAMALALAALGYGTLAWRIAIRLHGRKAAKAVIRTPLAARPAPPPPVVRVTLDGSTIVVAAPYSDAFNARRRALGGRFDWNTTTHRFASTGLLGVLAAIAECYPTADVQVAPNVVQAAAAA